MSGYIFPAVNSTVRVCGRLGNDTSFGHCCDSSSLEPSGIVLIDFIGGATYCQSNLTVTQFKDCLESNSTVRGYHVPAFCQNAEVSSGTPSSTIAPTPTKTPSSAHFVRPPSLNKFYSLIIGLLLISLLPLHALAAQCTSFNYNNAYTRSGSAVVVSDPITCTDACLLSSNQTTVIGSYSNPSITSFDIFSLALSSVPKTSQEQDKIRGFQNSADDISLQTEVLFNANGYFYLTFVPILICINGTVEGCDGSAGVNDGTLTEACTLQRYDGGFFGAYAVAQKV